MSIFIIRAGRSTRVGLDTGRSVSGAFPGVKNETVVVVVEGTEVADLVRSERLGDTEPLIVLAPMSNTATRITAMATIAIVQPKLNREGRACRADFLLLAPIRSAAGPLTGLRGPVWAGPAGRNAAADPGVTGPTPSRAGVPARDLTGPTVPEGDVAAVQVNRELELVTRARETRLEYDGDRPRPVGATL